MSFQDAFWAAPPISRTLTAATVLISVPGHLGFYNLVRVFFLSDYVFTVRQLPEVWRLVTTFLITGPQLGLIMDPFFLYHYSSQLETGSPRFSRPGAYAFYLMFVSIIILLTGGVYLGGYALLHALSMALTYTFSQEDPNRTVGFFIVQMRAKYVPYASLVVTFLMAGPFMTMIQATGILAGHAYEFFDKIWPTQGGGQQWIQPPQIVQKWFALPNNGAQPRAYGTAFGGHNAGSQAAAQANRGIASGSAWNSRGAGRRLGSD
ncbi:unnamed protein product [Zymoseptoria tritici ST99CH_1A5]|uniref:Derlin n=1 Tax=Zymoseptoria tritici ST99CH_1A5 TaxID=1276529 RepID=A0A1Y6LS63_ZYMTR|nr:unnamed protein product [Zymoseptoria tritici ST99CH_3D1]SMY27195.1 unnamed protein product [Zymoseptoria tritici ST99CH_1A5]